MSVESNVINDIHEFGLNHDTRDIYLHSYVANAEEDPGVDYRMASTFYKNIRLLDGLKNEPIVIHMHSVGGCWGDGMAIYDAIRMCRSHITIIAYGQAESMSSIILQAADKRVMTMNAYFMCHYGNTMLLGNHLDVQKGAAFEKKITEVMLDIYSDVCVHGSYFKEKYKDITEEQVKNYLKRKLKDGDWYLDSNEAVYYGFADHVLGTQRCPNLASLKGL